MTSGGPDTPPQQLETPTRLSNFALGLDAAFCNIAGLVLTLTGAFMADWLGVAGWVATVFGVLLLLWSFVVTLFANRRVARSAELAFVAKANAVFVVAALAVIAVPGSMSAAGKVVLGCGAAVFAAFAAVQLHARKHVGV